jgi:EAL domain-containing protein (putative c-di-GMP-specific phosphodiesterase class I)
VVLAAGRLYGVEALLRWTHQQWGLIPTDQLIEAIEPSEIMIMLTHHIIQTATAQLQGWNQQHQPLRVAVNVSVQDLHEPAFVDSVAALLADHDVAPSQLTIEVTERMLMTDEPRVAHIAGLLRNLGVGLSLDDFGTGHASLQQLRQLPLTEVKIDRSYVNDMLDSPADLAIVTGVHRLARSMEVEVVAEGVEDQRTDEALARLPGIIGQGWYYGRPMNPEQLDRWRQLNETKRAVQSPRIAIFRNEYM